MLIVQVGVVFAMARGDKERGGEAYWRCAFWGLERVKHILNELKSSDLPKHAWLFLVRFKDATVCKAYLAGLCPLDACGSSVSSSLARVAAELWAGRSSVGKENSQCARSATLMF